ncbi:MAG TPA: DUF2141 domain-containing protein [Dokdonella sp.]
MKIAIARLLCLACVFCCAAQAADLDITVTDIRVAKGTLMIAVVDTAAAWDDQAQAAAAMTRKASGAQEVFHFSNLPPGSYAVKVMHDENDNGKLDVNFMGMPIEGYGFSNNPQLLRKPTFDEAKFELGAGGGAITIHLR